MGIRRIAAAGLALLAFTSPATARTVFEGGREPDAEDWRLTSRGLVAADSDTHIGPYRIRFHPNRGRPRVLTQFDRAGRLTAPHDEDAEGGRFRDLEFDASGDRVAVAVTTGDVYFEGSGPDIEAPIAAELWTAPHAGRAVRLQRCGDGGVIGPVSVDGDVVAWVGANCSQVAATIAVRDMTREEPAVTITPPPDRSFLDVQVAGDYVAGLIWDPPEYPWSERAPSELAVYSRSTGDELYRLPGTDTFDLQRDGKLATLTRAYAPREEPDCYGDQVAWRSPSEPAAQVIAARACSEEVFLARDRLLWGRLTGPGTFEVVTTNLAGENVERVFEPRPAEGDQPRWVLGYDGLRVAYFVPGCPGTRIVVDRGRELARSGPLPLETCTANLAALPDRLDLDGRGSGTLRVRCPRGCDESRIRLLDVARSRLLQFPHPYEKNFVRLRPLGVGGTRLVRFQLLPADRRRLARAGRLRVKVSVQVPQPYGAPRTFTRRLTLLP